MSKRRKIWSIGNSPSAANILYIPALIYFGIFVFYPFSKGIMVSFMEWDGYSDHSYWVGFEKYMRLWSDPDFYIVVKNTLIYGIGSTLLQNLWGLAYALLLDRRIRGSELVKTIVYMPVVISGIIMGYIWHFIFQYNGGALNDLLNILGKEAVDWMGSGSRAVWLMTFINTYQFFGIAMVIFLAGLQSIPKDYYEAAKMDGASWSSEFRNITFPLLMPAITVSVLLNIIGGLKLFDVIMAMTNGGPGYESSSISTMMYQLFFVRNDAGYAAALGNIMFVLIMVISLISLTVLRKREVEL